MTKGFIVSSAIHGALTPLALGKKGKWTNWDRENLLQSTYLLLHEDIQVLPPPDQHTGALGLYGEVVKHFPWLNITDRPTGAASRKVKTWLTRNPSAFSAAWYKAQADPNFQDWARIQRELFWLDHARSFKGLFNTEYIPFIYALIGCSEVDLHNIHLLTQNNTWVRRIYKGELKSEDAKIAEQA